MRLIAFKRAKHFKKLDPEFIVEYAHVKGKAPEGYETMTENHFLKELAKNEALQKSFEDRLEIQAELKRLAERDSEIKEEAYGKQMIREFKEFKDWKRKQGRLK